MVFEIIIAAVLIAFGLYAIYMSAESDLDDKELLIVLLIGAAALIGGGWIILTKLTLAIILTKLAGLILAGVGIFLVIGFPDIMGEYQLAGMSKAGVFFGLILIVLGLYLLFF